MADAVSSQNKKKQQHRHLGSLLRYFIGTVIQVELKSGRIYQGTLESVEDSMSLVLEHATTVEVTSRWRSSYDSARTTTTLAMVSIRGSSIRYIQFPDQLDLTATIKQGMERERLAAQKYKRAVRK